MIKPMTGAKLRTWRMKHNRTVDEASAMFGVDRTTWWRWENDDIRLRTVLAAACWAFDKFLTGSK